MTRKSIDLSRADNLYDIAKRTQAEAQRLGLTEADRLADLALSAAFNSRSGYEAAQIVDTGGSSKAWAYRTRGATWLRKGRKHLDRAREIIAKAQSR